MHDVLLLTNDIFTYMPSYNINTSTSGLEGQDEIGKEVF